MFFSRALYSTLFENYHEILPGLYLGNVQAAQNVDFLRNNDFDVIVNCTPDIHFASYPSMKAVTRYRIPVKDTQAPEDNVLMEQYLRVMIPVLYNEYKSGKKMFVHCYAGKQRSCIVMAALLAKLMMDDDQQVESGLKVLDKAIDHICKQRPQAFTYGWRFNFYPALVNYFST